ncbi:MAG: hypothetical protein DCF20_03475 [Pseudanabaena sp.]|nr:MAG: hypothetical protein DCF20_03475 [Pseudanabaena sp.]
MKHYCPVKVENVYCIQNQLLFKVRGKEVSVYLNTKKYADQSHLNHDLDSIKLNGLLRLQNFDVKYSILKV